MSDATLVAAARDAATRAHCPHSGFAVGVALRDHHGAVFTGANVENASYNLGLCAERVALFHAVTHGAGVIKAVVIATPTATPTPPCGACRQALWEFAKDATVTLVYDDGTAEHSVAELLPGAFDETNLGPSSDG